MFLSPSDSFTDKYIASLCWAYYVNKDGTITPTIDNEKQKEFKASKLEKYLEKIEKIYEKKKKDK